MQLYLTMNRTKKLTLSSALAALAVVVLTLGSLVEVLDLTVVFIASLAVAFAVVELGTPWQWLTYLVSGLLAVLLVPNKFAAVEYAAMVGFLPILKYYVEKLPRALSFFLKIAAFNALYTCVMCVGIWVLGMPMESISIFGITVNPTGVWILLYVLGNIAYILYDYLLTRLSVFYEYKYRKRVQKWLSK